MTEFEDNKGERTMNDNRIMIDNGGPLLYDWSYDDSKI